MGDTNETSATLRNRDWFEYEEGATDFIPSRVFAIQSKQGPSVCVGAYIFRDPNYPFCPTNGDPTRYIILVKDKSSIPGVVEVMKKLSEQLDTEITGVHSRALTLKAKTSSTSRNSQCSNLEGELIRDFYEHLTIIQSIQHYTGQTVELRSVAITNPSVHQYANMLPKEIPSELITETIHLSTNVKSLQINFPLPSGVAQHLARVLYGDDESRSPKTKGRRAEITMSDNEHETQGSSLDTLLLVNLELSGADFNRLVQPKRLTNLRNLYLWSSNFLENMERDNLSLEELDLCSFNSLLEEEQEEDIAESMAKPLLREEEKESTKDDDFMKTRGKLVNLRLLKVYGVLTSAVEHLVVSRISRLKTLRLDCTEADLKSVSTILTSVSQYLEVLSLSDHFLSGNLRTILTGINQQCTFCYLKKLTIAPTYLMRSGLTTDDIEALSTAVQCGRFPELSELGELHSHGYLFKFGLIPCVNRDKMSAVEHLLQSCVNYYKDRAVTIRVTDIDDRLRSICAGSNIEIHC